MNSKPRALNVFVKSRISFDFSICMYLFLVRVFGGQFYKRRLNMHGGYLAKSECILSEVTVSG